MRWNINLVLIQATLPIVRGAYLHRYFIAIVVMSPLTISLERQGSNSLPGPIGSSFFAVSRPYQLPTTAGMHLLVILACVWLLPFIQLPSHSSIVGCTNAVNSFWAITPDSISAIFAS